jgi:hypothetical protein
MYNAYPFVPSWDTARPEPGADAHRQANRMDVQRHHEEYKRMNTVLYGYEQHVQNINAQRQQDAMMAEQIRLATGDRESRLAKAARGVRVAIGGMFIAAGERIRPEPLPCPEIDVDAIRRATKPRYAR